MSAGQSADVLAAEPSGSSPIIQTPFRRSYELSKLASRSVGRLGGSKLKQLFVGAEKKEQSRIKTTIAAAEDLGKTMGNMKGLAMKFGQILSFTMDSLPEPAQQALQALQRDAPSMPSDIVRDIIEQELNITIESAFAHYEDAPFAAASIGQVHRATLKDGRDVVLKVQYPGVDKAIESDLKLGAVLQRVMKPLFPNADHKAIFTELKSRVLEELDYLHELKNQQFFAEVWHGHPYISVPEPIAEYSSKRVLCQSFVSALGFYDFIKQSTPHSRSVATAAIHDFTLDSIHLHSVFNGDPHPGNYLFRPDGGVCFLDFGCVKYFDPDLLAKVRQMHMSIIGGDKESFFDHIVSLGFVKDRERFDIDQGWEFFRHLLRPFLEDHEFEFTKAYIEESKEVMHPKNLRHFNLPADFIFLNRITFGLNSIYVQLGGAKANYYRLYKRQYIKEQYTPSAIASLGLDLPNAFK